MHFNITHRNFLSTERPHLVACAAAAVLLLALGCMDVEDTERLQRSQVLPSGAPITIPEVARCGETVSTHENELFDWYPDYNLNLPAFDDLNRPYIRVRGEDRNLIDGRMQSLPGSQSAWQENDFLAAVNVLYGVAVAETMNAAGWFPSSIVFDRDGDAYTALAVKLKDGRRRLVLLNSHDRGRSWTAYEFPWANMFVLETANSQEPIQGPPALLTYTRGDPLCKPDTDFGACGDLNLIPITKNSNGTLSLGAPILLTSTSFGAGYHSGGANQAVTRGNQIFVTWGEVNTASSAPMAGSPMYIGVYNRTTQTFSQKYLGRSYPANDSHNQPGITIDDEGYLHVITGSHNGHFYWYRSPLPNTVAGTWPAGTMTNAAYPSSQCEYNSVYYLYWFGFKIAITYAGGCQTYLSLVSDAHGTLHMVNRQYRQDSAYHGGDSYMALTYQRKTRGGVWEQPQILYVPPISRYSIYYHKLSIDRKGRLYLSYSYYSAQNDCSTGGPYDQEPIYRYPGMLVSGDSGNTWDLALTEDFGEGGDWFPVDTLPAVLGYVL